MYYYLFSALALSFVAHFRWFIPGVYTYGDWWHTPRESALEWLTLNSLGPWRSAIGFGDLDPQIYFAPLNFIRGLFALLPYGDYWGLFFVYLLPIIMIAPIGSFLLLRRFVPDDRAAFIGSIFYIFSTYFLTLQTSHLTIALAYAYAPILILCIANFFLEKHITIQKSLITGLVISYGIIIEPRIFFIMLLIFIPCILFVYKKKYATLFVLVCVLFLNTYWIGPFILIGSGDAITQLIDRPLFGNTERSMQHAITSMQPAWSWHVPQPFDIQRIYPQFWIFPLVIFYGLLYISRLNRSAKYLTLWIYIVAFIGIFLAKQSHDPFPHVYGWLFENMPGFSLFRESSKFFILINIAYAYIITFFVYSILVLKKSKGRVWVAIHASLILGIILSSIYNTAPLITGHIDTMFISRSKSYDYDAFEHIIFTQQDHFRVMGIPQYPRMMRYSHMHPKVDLMHAKNIYESDTGMVNDHIDFVKTMMVTAWGSNFLHESAIRYIFVPPEESRNNDHFFYAKNTQEAQKNRNEIIEILNNASGLELLSHGDNNQIAIYKNKNEGSYFKILSDSCDIPSLTLDNEQAGCPQAPMTITIYDHSPMYKKIAVHDVTSSFYLTMSEKFDHGWSARNANSAEAISEHFPYQQHFNGWFFDFDQHCHGQAKCSVDLIIEHKAYHIFRICVLISASALGVMIILMSGLLFHKKSINDQKI